MTENVLLDVRSLSKEFAIRGGLFNKVKSSVKAVNNISFQIKKGETLGLVGESGCGKTTLGRCLLRLIEPSCGEVFFDGDDICKYSGSQLREIRKRMQIIFQDPYASLNPRMSVSTILSEPIKLHWPRIKSHECYQRLLELLNYVGLPRDALSKYPHEFSGGQRQRICIARALAVRPEFIVCDEPVSALDVSVQAQVVNLLMDLQDELGLTYLFIAHDLKVVEFISQRVAVMYLGNIVEMATSEELYHRPRHPYTKALISAIPIPDPSNKSDRIILKGDVPSPLNPPSGCHFHPRCWKATDVCLKSYPVEEMTEENHRLNCYHPVN